MQVTYENRPEKDTPPRVRAMLLSYGGRTPDGRPLWRLVKSGNRRVRIAGVMTTMPPGVVPEDARRCAPKKEFFGCADTVMPAGCWRDGFRRLPGAPRRIGRHSAAGRITGRGCGPPGPEMGIIF